ncbi:hypothetical protein [Selenomonas ruminantium]|uniref:hypothetical protein n=1 Tax=Selenomonas ruminantium TaxID=971 RepID=UPI0026EDB284|nr:hypothetical protein [Selenomonas ruminantium]
MKLLVDIPDEELDMVKTFISEHNGKMLQNGYDISVIYFTPQDAASALQIEGLNEKTLAFFDREKIIRDVLYKVKECFEADIPMNFEKFCVIASIVAHDYNERFSLVTTLPQETDDYEYRKTLLVNGLKPINIQNEAEVNEIRIALFEAVQSLATDVEQFMVKLNKESYTKLLAGLDFIEGMIKEIEDRLYLSTNIMDKERAKAILFPTVMPYDFKKESDYVFASSSGLDSFCSFFEDLKISVKNSHDFKQIKEYIHEAVMAFLNRPFGGKMALVMKNVLINIKKG